MNPWQTISGGLISPFILSGLSILGSSDGSLRLLIWFRSLLPCDSITSCSCMCLLCSGNRCPGVLWSGVLVLLLPSFSSLSSMARKLINFQSSTILVAFLGKCQVFGLKISFEKTIGSSSYSSITISSRVLLLIFWSSFLQAFWLKSPLRRIFTGGVLEDFYPPLLSVMQCGTASKTCEEHGHSAMP